MQDLTARTCKERERALDRRGHWLKSSFAGLGLLVVLCPDAPAAETTPSRMYEMTTETGMPHLEHNLRYAVRKEQRCMSPRDLSSVFWMLNDVSLQDCRLEKANDQAETALYVLMCDGGHGTTGNAQWQFEPEQMRGTLNVRLGGKNMTFYQRVTAKPVGECVVQ